MPVILPCRCPLRARCSHAAPRIARCASTHPPLLHPIVLHCKRLSDGAFYEILDSTQQAESGGKYAYSFNVCGDVQKKETKCASTPTQVTTATAYQVSVDEGWCYPVGDSPEAFSVIGSTTKGVKMGLLTHYDSPDDLNRKGTGMTDSTRVRSSSSQCATFCSLAVAAPPPLRHFTSCATHRTTPALRRRTPALVAASLVTPSDRCCTPPVVIWGLGRPGGSHGAQEEFQ